MFSNCNSIIEKYKISNVSFKNVMSIPVPSRGWN